MTLDVIGVLRGAWRTWLRDRDLLLRIAGPFYFLPALMVNLLVSARPEVTVEAEMTQEQRVAAVQPMIEWLAGNAPVFITAELLSAFGSLTVLVLYLGPTRATVGDALRRALRLFPRFLVAMVLLGLPVSIGYLTLVLLLPGLYLLGRLFVAGPALVAEPPSSLRRAFARSFALTRGNGFTLAGMVTLVLLASLLAWPFQALGETLVASHADNPVTMLMVGGLGALVSAAAPLAMVLLQIAIYRNLVARNGI